MLVRESLHIEWMLPPRLLLESAMPSRCAIGWAGTDHRLARMFMVMQESVRTTMQALPTRLRGKNTKQAVALQETPQKYRRCSLGDRGWKIHSAKIVTRALTTCQIMRARGPRSQRYSALADDVGQRPALPGMLAIFAAHHTRPLPYDRYPLLSCVLSFLDTVNPF